MFDLYFHERPPIASHLSFTFPALCQQEKVAKVLEILNISVEMKNAPRASCKVSVHIMVRSNDIPFASVNRQPSPRSSTD